jgi:hypothetical protein
MVVDNAKCLLDDDDIPLDFFCAIRGQETHFKPRMSRMESRKEFAVGEASPVFEIGYEVSRGQVTHADN